MVITEKRGTSIAALECQRILMWKYHCTCLARANQDMVACSHRE